MLTVEKLQIYQSYNGDIDGWAQRESHRPDSSMTDDDWYLIDELRQGLSLVSAGASKEFKESLEIRIAAETADDATRQILRALAVSNSTGT